MLQSTEYSVVPYLKWYWRTTDFGRVAKRRTLDMTQRAKLLLLAIRAGILLQVLTGLLLIAWTLNGQIVQAAIIGVGLVLLAPVVWAQLIVAPLVLARWLVTEPKARRQVAASAEQFAAHPATTIAVVGSYGKTTVKELLLTVLGEGKKVAATPANKNVARSHAAWVRSLDGDEEVLIIEYGEGKPGDVARFAATTHPDKAVITGLAPAHLDRYKTLEAAAEDIFSVAEAVGADNVYVNADSPATSPYLRSAYHTYSSKKVLGWTIANVQIAVNQTSFTMKKGKTTLNLTTKLVGRHLIGPLALCAALAADLGLTTKQIEAGVAKTVPFEHRMQPRLLAGGWLIDDTYNGNLEGIRAGLALLKELDATRKIYVTPGLVDQGDENQAVHTEVGQLIAHAKPDRVVLMKNSVTRWIQAGLEDCKYRGEVVIEDDPLNFYSNLDQVIAVGDVILMQNDWTDNYN